MGQRITDKLVKALEAPTKGNRITYDTDLKGFGVRVTAKGTKAFVFNYRAKTTGRERRKTIGEYGPWSVAAAREEAKDLKRRVDRGEDPMGDQHALRTAPTVADLAERFTEGHIARKRPSTQRDYLRQLEKDILPRIGRIKVADVTRADVERCHHEMSKRAPIQANRALAVTSAMFTFAIKLGWLETNPCRHIERNAEEGRERFLSQAEIVNLGEALNEYPNQDTADCLRFIMLTGCRRGEAMNARWQDIDLEAGIWVKPSAHTKQKKPHRVPLGAAARELLSKRRATVPEHIDWVFPGRDHDAEPLKQIRACWDVTVKRAGLEGVRIHDLRHTYASILASAGVSLPMVGALLGHTQPKTTSRYAHLYDDPLRAATDRVGEMITAGNKEAEVVPMRRKAK